MTQKTDEIVWYRQHKTPEDVAKYFLEEVSDVGRKYKTHGELWSVDHQVRIVGLLELIYHALTRDHQHSQHEKFMRSWSAWVDGPLHRVRALVLNYKKERSRIVKLMGRNFNTLDRCWGDECRAINMLGDAFCHNMDKYIELRDEIENDLKLMRKIKKVSDAILIPGWGKKTAQKVMDEQKKGGH